MRVVRPITASAMRASGLQETYDGVGRTVLVTGANSGIGLESCKQLVAAGCTVVMACRSADKALRAVAEVASYAKRGGRAEPAVMDLGSLASVRAFAQEYLESGAPLDVLVCNAVSSAKPRHIILSAARFERGRTTTRTYYHKNLLLQGL